MKLIKINEEHYELDGVKVTDRLSEVKELLGVVDVEKRAKNHLDEQHNNEDIAHPESYDAYHSFLKGYTQAIEDNKEKKYTEEDVICIIQKIARKYFNEGREYKGNMAIAGDPLHGLRSELKKYIQSLQPNTEWEVEFINGKLTLI